MAGAYRNIIDSAEKFKQADFKTMGEYEKEAEAKKAKKPAVPVKKKSGGKVKSYAKGGGCEIKGKTKGRFV